jgi:hypothetical protein
MGLIIICLGLLLPFFVGTVITVWHDVNRGAL